MFLDIGARQQWSGCQQKPSANPRNPRRSRNRPENSRNNRNCPDHPRNCPDHHRKETVSSCVPRRSHTKPRVVTSAFIKNCPQTVQNTAETFQKIAEAVQKIAKISRNKNTYIQQKCMRKQNFIAFLGTPQCTLILFLRDQIRSLESSPVYLTVRKLYRTEQKVSRK